VNNYGGSFKMNKGIRKKENDGENLKFRDGVLNLWRPASYISLGEGQSLKYCISPGQVGEEIIRGEIIVISIILQIRRNRFSLGNIPLFIVFSTAPLLTCPIPDIFKKNCTKITFKNSL
jgi:hypothetical protein